MRLTGRLQVNHLKVLADAASDHPRNPTLLDHLRQTYTWLNDHIHDAEQFLRQCTEDGDPLFLNVDDPGDAEEWTWKRGDHILLDEDDTGYLEYPRDFIKPFRPLLIAAGAVIIKHGTGIESSEQEPSADGHPIHLGTRLNQMRRDRICTDVSFTCDPLDGEPVFAHRACLAACNSHFRNMFSGAYLESNQGPLAQSIQVPGFSRRCIEGVLGESIFATW